jgi:hypothetical protein
MVTRDNWLSPMDQIHPSRGAVQYDHARPRIDRRAVEACRDRRVQTDATDTYSITGTWNGAKNELNFSYSSSFIIFNNLREYRVVSRIFPPNWQASF